MKRKRTGTCEAIKDAILKRIRSGEWSAGTALPSERELMDEFKVSRIPLREAIAGLRALGVLHTRPRSGTRVARVDARTVAQLLPLLVTLEGPRTFAQVFDLRLAVEAQTAALAARHHTDADAAALRGILSRLKAGLATPLEDAVETDLEFHVAIARATRNPLLEVLMRTLAELVKHVQVESCKDDPVRRRRAHDAHEAIADAILARDADRARAEMEAHLRYSATRLLAARPALPETVR